MEEAKSQVQARGKTRTIAHHREKIWTRVLHRIVIPNKGRITDDVQPLEMIRM